MFIPTLTGNYINSNLLVKIFINPDTRYAKPRISARDCIGTEHHISEHENRADAEKTLKELIKEIHGEVQNRDVRVFHTDGS